MDGRHKPPNDLLRAARLRKPSPSGSALPMSRRELADAVSRDLTVPVDDKYIGKLERGDYRWPGQAHRDAFRAVLGVNSDAELGFYVTRGAWRSVPMATATSSHSGAARKGLSDSTADERAYELFVRGYALLGANDRSGIARAQELLERAVSRDPQFARALAARGYTRWRQYFAGWATSTQSLVSALRDVDAALNADPDSVLAHMTFVRACWDMGWHERALQSGRSIATRSADSLDAKVTFARALMNAGLAEQALPLVGEVTSVDPTHPAAVKLEIWCRVMLGDYGRAVDIGMRFLQTSPTDANTRWAIALACQNLPGWAPTGIRVASEAVQADPSDLSVRLLLGYLHRLNDDETGATNAWTTALKHAGCGTVKSSNHRTSAWMANIYACLGDTSSAVDTVERLLADDRENGYLRYRLGHVLAEVGRLDEAVQMLDSAVDRGFLSAQLWHQEEIFALSRVRERNDYAIVTRRLAGNVDRCRITYAADLPVSANNNHPTLEIRSSEMTLANSDKGWIAGIAGDWIVTVGDPRLKAPTKTVEDAGDVKELLTSMVDRLRSLNGAGLAAPQVGVSAKVVVVEVRKTDVFPDRPESPLLQMINPVIVAGSDETEDDWEGCFSVPGLMGQVRRFRTITVDFIDVNGQNVREEYTGYLARVIQHEIDHLDGVEFLDRLTSPQTLTTVQNYIANRRMGAS